MEKPHPSTPELVNKGQFRIEEIRIQSYRGIDTLEFKPKTINIFVGKNNSGKSSVLNGIFLNLLGLHDYKRRSKNLVSNISHLFVKPLKYEIFNGYDKAVVGLKLSSTEHKNLTTRLELQYNLDGWPNIEQSDAFEEYLKRVVKDGRMYKEARENLYQETIFLDYTIDKERLISNFIPPWSFVKPWNYKPFVEKEMYDYKELANSRKYFDEITKYYDNKGDLKSDNRSFFQNIPLMFWKSNSGDSLKRIYQDLVKYSRIKKALENITTKLHYFKDLRYIRQEFIVSLKDDCGKEYSLPLVVMGDGFKSLISLAFRFTTIDAGILLMEEPENYLHPGYIDLLCEEIVAKSETCQVFFTTHSMNLLSQLIDKLEKAGKMDSLMLIRMRRDGKGIDREFLYKEDIIEELHEIEVDLRGY
ncbi:MAG: AAA family ATPase [Promethearchaeota archaeon]